MREEIWVVYYKKVAGLSGISYEDAVQEAVCFGWIDGKIQKIDELRYARRFTPRKPDSRWSESNIRRVERLTAEGKMTAAGLAFFKSAHRLKTLQCRRTCPRNSKHGSRNSPWLGKTSRLSQRTI